MRIAYVPRDEISSARPEPLVTATNHGLLSNVAVAFSLTMIGLALIVRMMIRWPATQIFGRDDAANLVAVCLNVVQSVLVLVAVKEGFGRKGEALEGINQPVVEKLIFASDIFYVITLFASKMVVAFLFDRIAGFREYKPYTLGFGIGSGIFALVSVLLVAIGPSAIKPWLSADSRFVRWILVEVFGMLIDIVIVVFPIFLLWNLRMPFPKKFWIFFGFATRLPLLGIAGARLWTLKQSLYSSDQFLFAYITTEIVTQVEQCYSVLCATIPCLGILLLGANSGMLPITVTMTSSVQGTAAKSKKSDKGSSGNRSSGNRSSTRGVRASRGQGCVQSCAADGDVFELTDRSRGQTTATATREKRSMESDKSRRAILVRQTIDVQYESNHECDGDTIGESATDLRLPLNG